MALLDPAAHKAAYPTCWQNPDANHDGVFNNFDIDLFVSMVIAGTNSGGMCGRRFFYDEENRLVKVTKLDDSDVIQEISYDALGRRVTSSDYRDYSEEVCFDSGTTATPTVTLHVLAGLETLEEHIYDRADLTGAADDAWGIAREFVWGSRFPEPVMLIDYTDGNGQAASPAHLPKVFHYLLDRLGSVVALVDSGDQSASPPVPGRIVERYTYDPYGKTLIEKPTSAGATTYTRLERSGFGNPFTWTSQRFDAATGLHAFANRMYSDTLHWLQRDPLGYVDGVSMYAYVAGRAMSATDPLGLWSLMRWVYTGDGNASDEVYDASVQAAAETIPGWTVAAADVAAGPVGARVVGAVQTVTASGTAVVGGVATLTGAGGIVGAPVTVISLDAAAAGFAQLITGEWQPTALSNLVGGAASVVGVEKDDLPLVQAVVTGPLTGASLAKAGCLGGVSGAKGATAAAGAEGAADASAAVQEAGAPCSAAENSAAVRNVNPARVRYSQNTAGGNGRADILRQSMRENGWVGDPVDAVQTTDGITTVDNTRVAVARELGMDEIPVRVHGPSDPLPPDMVGRFGEARTWGEAIAQRTGNQNPPLPPTGTSNPPRMPAPRN